MSEIVFLYNSNEVVILCKENEKFGTIIQKFCEKTELCRDSIYFLFNGQILDEEMNESQVPTNEYNKKIIVVYDYEHTRTQEDKIVKSEEIICPKCKESTCISIHNYKISLFQCRKGHKVENISFAQFDKTQNINLSSIICHDCKKRNKGNVNNNEFFVCLNCKHNLCPLCKLIHNKSHNIINYEHKNCICEEHGEPYTSYCKTCNQDICMSCDENHDEHDIEFYQKMKYKRDQIKDNISDLRKHIDQLNILINGYIEKFNKVKDILEKYYEIVQKINQTTKSKDRNYNRLFNISLLVKNEVNKDIQNIMNEKDNMKKIEHIIEIYEKSENQKTNKDNNNFKER